MDETQKKIKRLQYWAIFLIIVGAISAYFLPEYSIQAFFGLLGDIAKMIMIWGDWSSIVSFIAQQPNRMQAFKPFKTIGSQ